MTAGIANEHEKSSLIHSAYHDLVPSLHGISELPSGLSPNDTSSIHQAIISWLSMQRSRHCVASCGGPVSRAPVHANISFKFHEIDPSHLSSITDDAPDVQHCQWSGINVVLKRVSMSPHVHVDASIFINKSDQASPATAAARAAWCMP